MRKQKKSKRVLIKPRAPIYAILGKGGAHKSNKDYNRQKAKKEVREIEKKEID
ncbi:MAG: hypothetical protein HYT63_02765 [Candidatus Yanofskybacteria bacterium]|nr:hypothetical protein [Candidatus Yanofskybacteria bacterium]